jgi:HAD superfamily hydrolase (TIGR01509 family)
LSLKAIIFDCDGVIADTEPVHFAAFQKVLGQYAIELTLEDYYSQYLALDDRGCFTRAFSNNGRSLSGDKLRELIERKAAEVEPAMRAHLRIFPGVADFIRRAAQRYRLAIASGALRHEVELIAGQAGVRDCFTALTTAEDVNRSKPHPDPFLKALTMLNAALGYQIKASECLVIEDAIHGVSAAHLAGMLCVAVTNTYSRAELSEAELIVAGLEGLELKDVERLF